MRKAVLAWCGVIIIGVTGAMAEPAANFSQVEGHVMMRTPGSKKLQPVAMGRSLELNEAVFTGDTSRFEVRPMSGGGLWRLGRRAAFILKEGGDARLLAGTALVQVPEGATWRVESIRSVVGLPPGSWLVQAVDNRGLKVVCLDASEPVQAWGDPLNPAEVVVQTLRLKPGDVTFLQPEGKAFSPVVTIYLEEALSTSRLVNGFSSELPGLPRLANQAIAQRERLTKLSPAVIVGASKAGGFQIGVPKPSAPPKGDESADEEAKAP
jgi:hypothetical protein